MAKDFWNQVTTGKCWSPSEIVKVSYSWAVQFFSVSNADMIECHNLSYGEWLTGKRLFLNTDGVVQLESRNATFGGVLRDENGCWISGYNRYLGKCSIFDTELWGILEGLKLS